MKDKRTLLYSTPPSLARLCKESTFQFKMLRVRERERPRISHWPPAQGFLQMQFWSAEAPRDAYGISSFLCLWFLGQPGDPELPRAPSESRKEGFHLGAFRKTTTSFQTLPL